VYNEGGFNFLGANMKKIWILALSLLLIACTNAKKSILEIPNLDFDVCGTGCVNDTSTAESFFTEVYQKQLDLFVENIDPNRFGDSNITEREIMISRDELIMADSVQYNDDFPILNIYINLNHYVEVSGDLLSECAIGYYCAPTWLFGEKLLDFDYGFSELGGYFKYMSGSDLTTSRYVEFKFALDGANSSYLYVEYNYIDSCFVFESFSDGVYQKYRHYSDDRYYYEYLDVTTLENLSYSITQSIESFEIFDTENQTFYSINGGSFKVAKYQGTELVAYAYYYDILDYYGYLLNFKFVPDWDELYYVNNTIPIETHLYDGGNEVYSEYQVVSTVNIRYALVAGILTDVTEEELVSHPFPLSFSGGVTIEDLLSEMAKLENEENLLHQYGITPEDILVQCLEIRKQFENVSIS